MVNKLNGGNKMTRYIHMMTAKKGQGEKIEQWCQERGLPFLMKSTAKCTYTIIYYFSVRTDTAGYEMLKAEFPEVQLTDNARLGNILDCNDDTLHEFEGILTSYQHSLSELSKADEWFKDFIMKLDSAEKLEAIKEYSHYLSKHGERLLEERILFFRNEPDEYEKYLAACIKEQDESLSPGLGDSVYIYNGDLKKVVKCHIDRITLTKNETEYHAGYENDIDRYVIFTGDEIGKEVALTESEAAMMFKGKEGA